MGSFLNLRLLDWVVVFSIKRKGRRKIKYETRRIPSATETSDLIIDLIWTLEKIDTVHHDDARIKPVSCDGKSHFLLILFKPIYSYVHKTHTFSTMTSVISLATNKQRPAVTHASLLPYHPHSNQFFIPDN